jgi:hypothetical protein
MTLKTFRAIAPLLILLCHLFGSGGRIVQVARDLLR